MLICKRKSNGELINDFQEKATPGTLISNAVRAGLGEEADFEEVDVTKAEYEAAAEQVNGADRVAGQQAIVDKEAKKTSAKAKLKALGLTDEEIDAISG